MNTQWETTELFFQSFNHMEWMRFLLKRRKSFCVSVVFFFPNDNLTQMNAQQYWNKNKMEKITCCSFLASENILIQIWRMLFFFSFSLFFIRPKGICKLLKRTVLWCIHCSDESLEEFFIELSFLFTKWEECFEMQQISVVLLIS